MIKKVFCKDCRFIKLELSGAYCNYPENYIKEKDTWYREEYKYNSKPEELNKNNDCKWFKV